ncbi:hypothetical protein CDAR_65381 [Caerostris darwini]|uniref:Uncharacterized protein n=1 Tax=Caerostris darwini TaxID=1538125 RepID=A0AAV4W6S4_9ARAC|nr:hypothetical protein CDAR_65381 [Caerostris darwini]
MWTRVSLKRTNDSLPRCTQIYFNSTQKKSHPQLAPETDPRCQNEKRSFISCWNGMLMGEGEDDNGEGPGEDGE